MESVILEIRGAEVEFRSLIQRLLIFLDHEAAEVRQQTLHTLNKLLGTNLSLNISWAQCFVSVPVFIELGSGQKFSIRIQKTSESGSKLFLNTIWNEYKIYYVIILKFSHQKKTIERVIR